MTNPVDKFVARKCDPATFDKTDRIDLLNELVGECNAIAIEKGFWNPVIDEGKGPVTPLDTFLAVKIALAHSELSECLEELRNPKVDNDKVAEELADVIIRVFDMAGFMDLNLGKALIEKMQRNALRPHLHGKLF